METHLHPDDLREFVNMYYKNPDGCTKPDEYAALSVYRRSSDHVIKTWLSCHAKIQGLIKTGFKSFVTYVNAESEDHKEYIYDVLSPTGYWGSVLPEGCWDYVTDGDDNWIGVSFKHDPVMSENDGLFYNMLVSLRQAAEHSFIVSMYKRLKQVFGEAEAFFIVHSTYGEKDLVRFTPLQSSHQSFGQQVSLQLFKNKTPRNGRSASIHSSVWNNPGINRMITWDQSRYIYVQAEKGEVLSFERIFPVLESGLAFYKKG